MVSLHPQLQRDCLPLGRFALCHLLLVNDASYPWFILVPDRPGVTEIYQLSAEDQGRLIRESSALSQSLARAFDADKINIAALGNLVPQLHVHHIVRYRRDPAWPAPIWGRVPARPYEPDGVSAVLQRLQAVAPAGWRLQPDTSGV